MTPELSWVPTGENDYNCKVIRYSRYDRGRVSTEAIGRKAYVNTVDTAD